jgi:hypothetical protein
MAKKEKEQDEKEQGWVLRQVPTKMEILPVNLDDETVVYDDKEFQKEVLKRLDKIIEIVGE